MNLSINTIRFRSTLSFALLALLMSAAAGETFAQQQSEIRRVSATTAAAPSPASADPFVAIETETDAGRPEGQLRAHGIGGKARPKPRRRWSGRTLLVRMRAKNMPLPTSFGVPRSALWVYVPNYQVKMYIGDLPITRTSETRGNSDSAYRFTNLPPDAEFGGLMLTAEPVRFTPIVNEALRPLLVGLVVKESLAQAAAATTIYAGQPPSRPGEQRDAQPAAGAPTTTAPANRQP